LSKFLYDHSDDWYFYDGIKPNRCRAGKCEPKKLRTIYSDDFKFPIDKGAIEALIPGSVAYSRLHQTNVRSYAIAGTYRPDAKVSQSSQESYYKTIVDPEHFNLDKVFDDSDYDLLVSVTSQLGGLPKHIRDPNSNDIPIHSAVYHNTVHEKFFVREDDGILTETNSPHIQKDVIKLLSSSNRDKFANSIGRDSNGSSK
jgi:hypothetical protein